ncbi:MAG: glycosyltransferase [Halalkalicoccus sp.]
MNVAFVHATPAAETALARRTRYWAGLLADRGHDATVLCTRWWDGEYDEFEREGVTYRAIAESPRWLVARLPGALSELGPDVVHAAASEPTAALAARLSGPPLVVEWCGREEPKRLDRALSGADRVVVPSEHVRTKVRERDVEATVLPWGIPIERIRETEPSGSAALVWSGRLDEHANLEGLLLALAEFRYREWRALVIGDGPRKDEYEGLARDLRVADRVDFVGERPMGDRIARLKGAHVFVHTADRCPFARKLLLALACGCVGIVEYQVDSAAHELIAGRTRGLGATDDEGIVAAIERAAELPQKEYDAGFEAFSHERVGDRYLDVLDELGDQSASESASTSRLGDEPLR